ncbi:MAG: 3'(2'),5'-bisphosphate nucleotidase CysQ [Xanthomonadales bacterium]
MKSDQLTHWETASREIAAEAGAAILDIYGEEFDVVSKADDSPLTQADLASHRVITAALARLTPHIPLLSEESADIPFSERTRWQEYWLIDPLDGTKEFIKRNGEFTVNIALIRAHRPVMGVVHVPVTGVTYSGIVGAGAQRHERDGAARRISVRLPSAQPPVVVGSRSHANPDLERHLAALGEYELVSMGSSLKFCLLAEGLADFYPRLGPTSEWDTAAAHAVVLAAGGQIVTLDGEPLRYNLKDSLLNPPFLVIADADRDWVGLFRSPDARGA